MDFFDRLLDRARTLPGVTSAGAAAFLPVSGGGSQIHFNIQSRPPKSPQDFLIVAYRPVSPRLHETLGIPLLRGRFLNDADTERSPAVAVINEAMARQYFPNQNPLGQRLQLGQTPEADVPWHEIVGIVGNVRQNLATDPAAEMYFPIRQANAVLPVNFISVVLRTAGDPRPKSAPCAPPSASSTRTSRSSRSARWRRTSARPSPSPASAPRSSASSPAARCCSRWSASTA